MTRSSASEEASSPRSRDQVARAYHRSDEGLRVLKSQKCLSRLTETCAQREEADVCSAGLDLHSRCKSPIRPHCNNRTSSSKRLRKLCRYRRIPLLRFGDQDCARSSEHVEVLGIPRVGRVAFGTDAQSTHAGVHCWEDIHREELVVRNVAMTPNRIQTSVYILSPNGNSVDRDCTCHRHMIGNYSVTRTQCDLCHMSYRTHAAQRRGSVPMILR